MKYCQNVTASKQVCVKTTLSVAIAAAIKQEQLFYCMLWQECWKRSNNVQFVTVLILIVTYRKKCKPFMWLKRHWGFTGKKPIVQTK